MICLVDYFQLQPAFQITVTTLYTLSAFIAAVGNSFCLVVLWQPSQKSKSNKVLTSLALSDCLVGYVCFPLAIWLINNSQEPNATFCNTIDAYVFSTLWITSCSTCSIAFISYDRYTFITKSNRYHDILTY